MSTFPPILITLLLTILTIFLVIYLYIKKKFAYWSDRNVFNLKPVFPFGNFNSDILSKIGITIENLYFELRKSGHKFGGYHLFTIPIFMPLDPELYKIILVKNFQNFYDRGIYYNEKNDPLTAHLVSLTGSKWRSIRTKLTPAFNGNKLKRMYPLIKKCSDQLIKTIDKSKTIDIHDIAGRYTTDIICSCAFGIECNSLHNQNDQFYKTGRKLIEPNFFDSLRLAFGIMSPGVLRVFRLKFFNPQHTKLFSDVVEQSISFRQNNNVKRDDLMDTLIKLKVNDDSSCQNGDDSVSLSPVQIAAQVLLFYLAGFETTAVTLAFAMYELAKDDEIQMKVRKEVLMVLQKNDGEFSCEALADMHYTQKVIDETLRMYPPIEMINRICTQQFRLSNSDITIEEGTRIVISVRGVHYDPEFYPDPMTFNPERFSNEEKAKRPDFCYFPFGDGPRICIGYKLAMIELKLALGELLRDHKFSVDPKTKSEIETISNGNMLGIKNKIYLNATKI